MTTIKNIIFCAIIFLMGSGIVLAEGKYAIKQMTPQVQQALDNRRDRFDYLRELKSSGAIGENNRGYVEVLVPEGDASAVISAENKDRKIIYQTIAEQNGLEEALATIESVFAQTQTEKAVAGDKIQTFEGQWVIK